VTAGCAVDHSGLRLMLERRPPEGKIEVDPRRRVAKQQHEPFARECFGAVDPWNDPPGGERAEHGRRRRLVAAHDDVDIGRHTSNASRDARDAADHHPGNAGCAKGGRDRGERSLESVLSVGALGLAASHASEHFAQRRRTCSTPRSAISSRGPGHKPIASSADRDSATAWAGRGLPRPASDVDARPRLRGRAASASPALLGHAAAV
jgi:hypothetical protein